MTPFYMYLSLMQTIRGRLDIIETLKTTPEAKFLKAEAAAFQGRKVIEATAFACLVATENGLKTVPRDAKGQWNAEAILKSLKAKGISALPDPSQMIEPSPELKLQGANFTIAPMPERRLSATDIIEMYRRFHSWLHELNPYTAGNHEAFYAHHSKDLWRDLERLSMFLDRHIICIKSNGFFCALRDKVDFQTKLIGFGLDAGPSNG